MDEIATYVAAGVVVLLAVKFVAFKLLMRKLAAKDSERRS